MFDIGFWELAIIAVVALLVVGPERLPRLARTSGMWIGKARRFVSSVKADIDRELAADELKKTLARQVESTGLHEIIEETKKVIQKDEDLSRKVEQATAAILNKSEQISDSSDPEQATEAVADKRVVENSSSKLEQPAEATVKKSNDADGQ